MSDSSNDLVKFRATIYMYPTENGGRSTPVNSGFRTDISFKEEVRFSLVNFLNKEKLFPGEDDSVEIYLWLHSDDELAFYLENSKNYVLSGLNKVGEITLLELLDPAKFSIKPK